jgi:hypothetical protein
MKEKPIPYDFIFDHLDRLGLVIKPMFGCYLVYRGNKMILFLRESDKEPIYNGVYIATSENYFDSLVKDIGINYPSDFFKNTKKRWIFIPESDRGFESAVLRACEQILKSDKRIGREKL